MSRADEIEGSLSAAVLFLCPSAGKEESDYRQMKAMGYLMKRRHVNDSSKESNVHSAFRDDADGKPGFPHNSICRRDRKRRK